jgi:hypothetical protein
MPPLATLDGPVSGPGPDPAPPPPPQTADTVHVLVPYFGASPSHAHHLAGCVSSVLAQTHPRWLLTIVDDGTPTSAWTAQQVLEDHDAAADPRVRLHTRLVSLGMAAAAARCLDLGQADPAADYVVRLTIADALAPTYLQTVLGAFRVCPNAVMVAPPVMVIDQDGRPHCGGLADRVKHLIRPRAEEIDGHAAVVSLLRHCWLYTPAICYQRTALAHRQPWIGCDAIADLAVVIDLLVGTHRSLCCPRRGDPVYLYRRHGPESATRARRETRLREQQRYYQRVAIGLTQMGWHQAAAAARGHWTTRAHALLHGHWRPALRRLPHDGTAR